MGGGGWNGKKIFTCKEPNSISIIYFIFYFFKVIVCINLTPLSGGSRISRRGGVDLVGGPVDPRGGYVSKILYVKTKESGPVGGARRARPSDPPMPLNYQYIQLEVPMNQTTPF